MSSGKEIKCEACRAFLSLFRNMFNKFNNTFISMNVRFYLSYDIMITLKCEDCRAYYLFFAMSLVNSIRQENKC